jgi:integrase
MPTFDTTFKSIPHAGGRIRKTTSGKYAAERSDGGRIRRSTCETVKEAKEWLSGMGARRNLQGRIATALTANQTRDAIDAFHRMAENRIEYTLCEILDQWMQGEKQKAIGEPVDTLVQRYIEDGKRRGLRERTLYDKENRLKSFAESHGAKNIGAVTKADVEAWLDATGAAGRNLRNYKTTIQGFFNWSESQIEGYQNTVAKYPQDESKDIEPAEIVTPKEAGDVLHMIEKRSPKAALVLALGLFAGLRTDEIIGKAGLKWADVDFENRQIFVQPSQAKTRRLRKVTITDNLLSWLKKYRKEKGRIGCGEDVFYSHRMAACESLRIDWPKNGARHSFGTYYARLKGVHAAAEVMGHIGGIAMFTEFYEGKPITMSDATRYFRIEPMPAKGAKIIKMEATA